MLIRNPNFDWFRATVRIITPIKTKHTLQKTKSKEAKTTFYLVSASEHILFFLSRPASLLSCETSGINFKKFYDSMVVNKINTFVRNIRSNQV